MIRYSCGFYKYICKYVVHKDSKEDSYLQLSLYFHLAEIARPDS